MALLRKDAAHQVGTEQPVRREHRDEALAMIEPTNRGNLRVSGPARQQRRRRVDQAGIDAEDFPGAIGNHAHGTSPHRQDHDLAALFAMMIGRQSQQSPQRYQRQQPIAQRHHAQHGRFGARDLRHLFGQRNDLSHALQAAARTPAAQGQS